MSSVRAFKKEINSIIDTHATILSFAYARANAAAQGGGNPEAKMLEQVNALYQESNKHIQELLANGFKPKGDNPKEHFRNLRANLISFCEEQEQKIMNLLGIK